MTPNSIRDEIKFREVQARKLREQIRNTKGRERYDAWNAKRDYGAGTRSLLLAYAFLRGTAYRRVEKTAVSVPNTDEIATYADVPLAQVQAWLAVVQLAQEAA